MINNESVYISKNYTNVNQNLDDMTCTNPVTLREHISRQDLAEVIRYFKEDPSKENLEELKLCAMCFPPEELIQILHAIPLDAKIPLGLLVYCSQNDPAKYVDIVDLLKEREYEFDSEYLWILRGHGSLEWIDMFWENISNINQKCRISLCSSISDCDHYMVHPLEMLHLRILGGDEAAKSLFEKVKNHPSVGIDPTRFFLNWTKLDPDRTLFM